MGFLYFIGDFLRKVNTVKIYSMLTVSIEQYDTKTPVSVTTIQVHQNATIGDLRTKIEEKLATEPSCVMRVFCKWYVEVMAGNRKRMIEIMMDDEKDSLSTLGIVDGTTVFLEGPLIKDFVGVGKALAMVSAQWRQSNAEQAALFQQLMEGQRQLAESMKFLSNETTKMGELQNGLAGPSALMQRQLADGMAQLSHLASASGLALDNLEQADSSDTKK
eukprot:GDKK01021153.1.p1 GENE.GDKK01021153.1~~GDKK01021153.1.p1  ORF type:complete len:218 (-),score=17.27 GDKK01021153.1:37-690(-)